MKFVNQSTFLRGIRSIQSASVSRKEAILGQLLDKIMFKITKSVQIHLRVGVQFSLLDYAFKFSDSLTDSWNI